ncbi:unnamed protein product [Moneuplotes crassus]|uniref:Uncharacterized protein n=1 Tax=Euplotes crassus TaxID=5936 RepID=A0AAD2CW74_EUPCR|nr:unnamed protein product [Moneuplotes crassus]
MQKQEKHKLSVAPLKSFSDCALGDQSTKSTEEDPEIVIFPEFSISINPRTTMNATEDENSCCKERCHSFALDNLPKKSLHARKKAGREIKLATYGNHKSLYCNNMKLNLRNHKPKKLEFWNSRLRKLAGVRTRKPDKISIKGHDPRLVLQDRNSNSVDHRESKARKKPMNFFGKATTNMVKSIKLAQRGVITNVQKARSKTECKQPEQNMPKVCQKSIKLKRRKKSRTKFQNLRLLKTQKGPFYSKSISITQKQSRYIFGSPTTIRSLQPSWLSGRKQILRENIKSFFG